MTTENPFAILSNNARELLLKRAAEWCAVAENLQLQNIFVPQEPNTTTAKALGQIFGEVAAGDAQLTYQKAVFYVEMAKTFTGGADLVRLNTACNTVGGLSSAYPELISTEITTLQSHYYKKVTLPLQRGSCSAAPTN